jgi:hypothetical protein
MGMRCSKWPKSSVMPRQLTPSAHGLETRASEGNCGSWAAFDRVGYGAFVSYQLKKQDHRRWVLSETVGIAARTVGVATGIAHW